MYKPDLYKVELCLTYRCNVKCDNCSSLCTQAPCVGDLSPDEVVSFLEDSIISEHQWKLITLHGGEPVLNPHIYTICEILSEYKENYNPNVGIWILSNNSTEKITDLVQRIVHGFRFGFGIVTKIGKNNEHGQDGYIPYIPVNDSPDDNGHNYTIGCQQMESCGICYNYIGYFPCSQMAAAARLFDYHPMTKTAKELTLERCDKAFKKHCKHCGFAASDRPRVKEQITSKTWLHAFTKYNSQRGSICQR